jgi:hypothetical protein
VNSLKITNTEIRWRWKTTKKRKHLEAGEEGLRDGQTPTQVERHHPRHSRCLLPVDLVLGVRLQPRVQHLYIIYTFRLTNYKL